MASIRGQVEPVKPETDAIVTCFPDTAGYAVITVGPSGRDYTDLQKAINDAVPGSVLVLDAGVRFEGSFTLPKKEGDGWIIITSSHIALLPGQENRIHPQAATSHAGYPLQRDAMPKIVNTNASGLPCFKTQAFAHHYRLVGLEITVDQTVTTNYGLIFFGSGAQSTLNEVPHDLIVDRCYIHGHDNATIMKAGILLNSAHSAVIDSYLSDFHSIGFDTYAIGCTNGPGPFKILNNYLEAAGENILFGGAAPAIAGLVPSDAEIRQNHFYKSFSWRVGHPDYAGKHWTIKNLFELKTGRRILLDGNLFENVWADLPIGQSGYAIVLTVRTEGGGAPQADVSDITITNNIIRHAGAGISLSGKDTPISIRSKRIKIANNLFDDISGPKYGDGNVSGPNDGTFIKIGEPTDVLIDHNTVMQSGPITWAYDTTANVSLTNNIFLCYLSAGNYQGIYGPGFAQGGNGPMGRYFPDITDGNRRFDRNVLIGGPMGRYSNYNTVSRNYFPAATGDVGFADFNSGASDYHHYGLLANSVYAGSGTGGTDPGVNFDALDEAQKTSLRCPTTVHTNENNISSRVVFYPNPAHEFIRFDLPGSLSQVHLVLTDIYGRTILVKPHLTAENNGLDIGFISSGVYFLRIHAEGELKETLKLIVP